MADNIAITAGSGTTVATDDCGAGGHAQIVKLAISTDGTITLIPADAANGLDVDVTRLPALVAGSALIGKVGIDQTTPGTTNLVALGAGELHAGETSLPFSQVVATFTRPANTTAYTAGDAVNDSTSAPTAMSFASFARVNTGGGYIVGARLTTSLKSVTPRFRVHLFNASNPTISNDNAAWQDRYADESKCIGSFDLPAMQTGTDTTNSTQSWAENWALYQPFKCASGTRTIYALLETLDAFTPASGETFSLTLYGGNLN